MSAIIEAINNAGFDFIDLLIISGVLGGIGFAGRKLLSKKDSNENNYSVKPNVDDISHYKDTQRADRKPAEQLTVKTNPHNQKHLEKIKLALDKVSVIYSRMIYSHLLNSGFKNISAMRQQLEPLWNTTDWTNEQLKYYINYVNGMDFSDSMPNVKEAIETTSLYMTDCYQELLDDVFKKVNVKYMSMKTAFDLPTDKKIEQQMRIKSVIMPLFADSMQSFDTAMRLQAYTRQNKQQFDNCTSGDFDWGSALRMFSSGFMAGAHPLVGVPMFLKNLAGESESSKRKQQSIDDYLQKIDECVTTLNNTAPMLHVASVKAADYCLGRSQELHINTIFFVCSKLDTEGADLAAACRSIVDKVALLDEEWGGSNSAYSL